jgi:hypothetical protein
MDSASQDMAPAEIQSESVEPQLTHVHLLQFAVKDAVEKQFAQSPIAPASLKVISCSLAFDITQPAAQHQRETEDEFDFHENATWTLGVAIWFILGDNFV